MFVTILVLLTLTANGPEFHTEISSAPFETSEKCEAFRAKLDDEVRENAPTPSAFATKCVEIKEDDVKPVGKQA